MTSGGDVSLDALQVTDDVELKGAGIACRPA
jgi:hypothetical protein